MGKGYTVEEQVTGEAKIGGLQFDIFPRRSMPTKKFTKTKSLPGQVNLVADEDRRIKNLTATPAELNLEQQTIAYVRWVSFHPELLRPVFPETSCFFQMGRLYI